ncbi:hypothetical protein [Streptomyces sp. NPDC002520]
MTVFPEECTSATASCLNSSLYRLLRLLLLPTWHYFLRNLMSQSPGVHDQGEGSRNVQYELTSLGRSLLGLLDTARAWAEAHLDELIDARETASPGSRTS